MPGEAKCCHVAALLYLLLDVKETGNPLLCQSTTDTTCYWAKGPSRVKDSRPLHLIKTGKKCRQNDRYIDIDPRPEGQKTTTKAEVNKFYVDANICQCGKRPCNCTSNWVAKKVISIKILFDIIRLTKRCDSESDRITDFCCLIRIIFRPFLLEVLVLASYALFTFSSSIRTHFPKKASTDKQPWH